MKQIVRKIIYYLFIIFLFILFLPVLSGCSVEDLGLLSSGALAEEKSADDFEATLSEEELFLEMKARQDTNQLSDNNIRKAIFYAINRQEIVDELFGGYSFVSNSLFPRDSQYWSQSWAEYGYNIEKAQEYLSKAGYGKDNPLYLTINSVDNSEVKKIIEEMIKEDLEKIGINLWIYNIPPKELYQGKICSGDYELALWSMFAFDGNDLFNSFSSNKIPSMETEENTDCGNFYWYKNAETDDLLREMQNYKDSDIKIEKVLEIQDILARDAVILPLYNRLFVLAYNEDLRHADLEIIGEKPFLNIESWKLPFEIEIPEGEKTEIIIGYESDHIDIINDFEKYFINDLVLDGLWKNNPDGTYETALLEDYVDLESEFTESTGLSLNVTLKDGIFWQDGDPIISDDIKYTFEYLLSYMEENAYLSKIDEDYMKIDEISIIDNKRFIIILKEGLDDWQKLFNQIYKKGTFDYYDPDNYPNNKIISSGPYKVVEYDRESKIVLEINENFYGQKPEIERLIIRFDIDINNLIVMLKENEIDALSIPVDHELMTELEKDNGVELLIKPGNLIEHLALSMKPSE